MTIRPFTLARIERDACTSQLTFTPYSDQLGGVGYTLDGPTRFDKLFTGIASPRPKSLVDGDQRGCENIGPEDTADGDYGRLLERAHVKGVASPPGFEPGFQP
jgi:hypothetical protein